MRPLNHFEAVSVLRDAGETVTVRAYRPGLVMGNSRQAAVENLSLNQSNISNTKSLVSLGTVNIIVLDLLKSI